MVKVNVFWKGIYISSHEMDVVSATCLARVTRGSDFSCLIGGAPKPKEGKAA